jgi:predicted GIY-YIG superfamily endonuclease
MTQTAKKEGRGLFTQLSVILLDEYADKYSKVASREVLWYNEVLNIVVLGSAANTPSRTNLYRRFIMTTLPDSAQNGNTPNTTYSVYQFVDPRTGKTVYVGFTSNPTVRAKQHLSKKGILHALTQELRQEGLALDFQILETTTSIQEARELEKKWIQAKGPDLNWNHNQAEIERRREEREFWEDVSRLCTSKGLTRQEALLYMQHFPYCYGDTYEVIEIAAQITREFLGIEGAFTASEILRIALKCKGIEVEG